MQLRVLAPTRYPWTFNGPRRSRHHIERRSFVPLNFVSAKLEGVTVFNPLPAARFDLVHAFNRIPLGARPFIIGFESHLPRAFGLEATAYFRWLTRLLASPRCRAIVAISEHAARIFRAMHLGGEHAEALLAKLLVRYPNFDIPQGGDELEDWRGGELTVTFVGNHFGRKGGCVALRLAEMAGEHGIPIKVEIVSALQVGGGVWTDPVSKTFFERYLRLLDLPNVRFHRSLDNASVQRLLRRSHLSLLTTFSDTFGFSAIESMANWTPVIGTRQCALPEFIEHLQNGVLLDLPVNRFGEWIYSASPERFSTSFESIYADEVERLAREAFDVMKMLVHAPDTLRSMRRQARATAERIFDAGEASQFWDELYINAVNAGAGVRQKA
jgi:glycosyltransferase involved in cell wall biosynthesis